MPSGKNRTNKLTSLIPSFKDRISRVLPTGIQATVELDSHADSSSMITVRKEPNSAGEDGRYQIPFSLQVRIVVSLQHLQHKKYQNVLNFF